MITHLLPVLCLVGSAEAPATKDVQRDGVVAVWFAPAVMPQADLPLAVQVGVQLGPRAMITAWYGALPIANIRASAWSVGARWYLGEAALAPFLTAEGGKLVREQDDTGGRQDNYAFASMGIGLEKVWAHHFSLAGDVQAGPGHRDAGSYHEAGWVLWSQLRLAVGLRF